MPEATAALAHEMVDLIIHAGKPSRGSIAILMAVAANPPGHMHIGQGSPTRKLSDLQKKQPDGTITEVQSKIATTSPRRNSRPALNHTHDNPPATTRTP